MQILCNRLDAAEARYDARTAREFKCSLPNELSAEDLVRITKDFVTENFTDKGLCTVAAIHDKRNPTDPSKNNPHAHIEVQGIYDKEPTNHLYTIFRVESSYKLGGYLPREITPMQIQALMVGLSGKSNSLQSKVLAYLRDIFKVAKENGLVAKSSVSDRLKAGGKATEAKQTPSTSSPCGTGNP